MVPTLFPPFATSHHPSSKSQISPIPLQTLSSLSTEEVLLVPTPTNIDKNKTTYFQPPVYSTLLKQEENYAKKAHSSATKPSFYFLAVIIFAILIVI